MNRILTPPIVTLFCLAVASPLFAQGGGGFGGSGNFGGSRVSRAPNEVVPPAIYDASQALNFITVDGVAEARVMPDEIRVVLAVTSEEESADECQKLVAEQIKVVRAGWTELKIPKDKIVEDFINVLPKYEWGLADRDGSQVRLQQRQGYRMQTNLHVAVKNEADAMAAINRAFRAGVTDIVTFDYWSAKLDESKESARANAIKAAQRKAETLLAVFERKPPVINVQEETRVFFPHSLYRTYENVLQEETSNWNAWRDKPMIRAFRPKMTFLQGVQTNADSRPQSLVMRPEIAIVSTVRIYYQSPGEHSRTVRR